MGLRFVWDPRKAKKNLSSHRVSFDEGATVFADPLAAIFDDPDHSIEEAREIIIGHSAAGRLLMVSFTAAGEEIIRIISTRPVTRSERKDYEENR